MPAISTDSGPKVSGSKASFRTWHRRLGHISSANVKNTASITEGIEFDGDNNENLDLCRPCKMGKALRTVSRDPQERSTNPLTELYIDTIGPITPVGFNGDRYGLMATCGCTRA